MSKIVCVKAKDHSSFSDALCFAVRRAVVAAGFRFGSVADALGLSSSSFSARVHGRVPFSAEDVARLNFLLESCGHEPVRLDYSYLTSGCVSEEDAGNSCSSCGLSCDSCYSLQVMGKGHCCGDCFHVLDVECVDPAGVGESVA